MGSILDTFCHLRRVWPTEFDLFRSRMTSTVDLLNQSSGPGLDVAPRGAVTAYEASRVEESDRRVQVSRYEVAIQLSVFA